MFTGLVEEIGVIKSIKKGKKSVALTISARKVVSDVKLGDSIATNGICLSVTSFTNDSYTVDVMPETLSRSNLYNEKAGTKVNLERALRMGDRLGGHMVSGHVDGLGELISKTQDDNAIWFSIAAPKEILKYIIEKGSVAIDGISLTVAYVDDSMFKVSIIPITQNDTTLMAKAIGDKINIECDMTAKYIEKFMFAKEDEKVKSQSRLSSDFLKDNGFF